MPEYKELERSLLARMFRTGVIDAATFMSRTEALGYDPDDVLLMVRLEKKEAGVTTLRKADWFSVSEAVGDFVTKEFFSNKVDVTDIVYLRYNHSFDKNEGHGMSSRIRFFDVADNKISEQEFTMVFGPVRNHRHSGSGTESIPVPDGAVLLDIMVMISGGSVGGEVASYYAGNLEGVIV